MKQLKDGFERLCLWVPVKSYSRLSRWRHGLTAPYHQRNTLVRSNKRCITKCDECDVLPICSARFACRTVLSFVRNLNSLLGSQSFSRLLNCSAESRASWLCSFFYFLNYIACILPTKETRCRENSQAVRSEIRPR
jgi:hypothetical protein